MYNTVKCSTLSTQYKTFLYSKSLCRVDNFWKITISINTTSTTYGNPKSTNTIIPTITTYEQQQQLQQQQKHTI